MMTINDACRRSAFRLWLFLLLLLFVFSNTLRAAQDDFRFRWGLKVNKEFRKGFDLGLEYQMRTNNNARNFHGSYFTVSPGYKLSKHFTALAEMRYATSYNWDKLRLGAGLAWRKSWGPWRLLLQGKYQYEGYRNSILEIGQFPPSQFIRFKVETGYKLNGDWKAYASCEPRYEITEGQGMLQRVKSTGGMEWEFIKHHRLDASYSWQPQYDKATDYTAWILEITYCWDIPKGKKKKAEEPKSP